MRADGLPTEMPRASSALFGSGRACYLCSKGLGLVAFLGHNVDNCYASDGRRQFLETRCPSGCPFAKQNLTLTTDLFQLAVLVLG
jgi:hypothetical protein